MQTSLPPVVPLTPYDFLEGGWTASGPTDDDRDVILEITPFYSDDGDGAKDESKGEVSISDRIPFSVEGDAFENCAAEIEKFAARLIDVAKQIRDERAVYVLSTEGEVRHVSH